jgi:hypothetical protein
MKIDLNNINWQTLINQRKELMIAVGLVISGLLISFLATYPQVEQLLKINNNISSEQETLNHLQQKTQALEIAKTMPEFLQKKEVDEILPSTKPFLELLTNLNKVASNTSIIISDLRLSSVEIATQSAKKTSDKDAKKPKTKQPGSIAGVDSISLDLTVEGEVKQVESFLKLIERVSPITTVTAIELKRKFNSSSNAITEANLTLKSFYFTKIIKSTLEDELLSISAKEKETLKAIISFQPANLPDQTTIQGGGKLNLFEVEKIPEGEDQELIRLGQ